METKPQLFQRGGQGGPGRPPRAIEREYLHAAMTAVPAERWGRILARLADFAEGVAETAVKHADSIAAARSLGGILSGAAAGLGDPTRDSAYDWSRLSVEKQKLLQALLIEARVPQNTKEGTPP